MNKKILIWIWCFPQMLIGLILRICTKAEYCGDHYRTNKLPFPGSVSLGEYIFLCPNHWDNETVLKHEKGHSKQSLYLGWLYLLVIGIPSFIWSGCFREFRQKHNISYYWFYTERWADELGGVERD